MEKLHPMMGWSTWNLFHQHISESLVLEMAKAMKEKGLLSAGYRYVNLDDCWQASQRDESARLCFDAGRFPSKEGIVQKLNSMGFRAGLYSSCGAYTCEDMPGSYGFEAIDAATFAKWGVEFLKYDYCHVVDLPTSPHYGGKHFAYKTPPILYLAVGESDMEESVYPAKKAKLSSPADLLEDAITGLDCPRARAEFDIYVENAGLCQVALGYVKEYNEHRKFLLLSVNGSPAAQVWFPPTSGWNSPGRATVNVELKKGSNALHMSNPIRGQRDDSILRYAKMAEALKKATGNTRPIYFSICEHGRTEPWTWAADYAASWRVSHDISPSWQSVVKCYEVCADLWPHQRPGAYNDPDMLEVGIGGLADEENKSHFALWCMMSAPLVLGFDVRLASEEHIALVTNRDLITINQDSLMLQASRTKLQDGLDLLIKPLAHGHAAVCLFNKSDSEITGTRIAAMDLGSFDSRVLFDKDVMIRKLVGEENRQESGSHIVAPNLPAHGVEIFLLG